MTTTEKCINCNGIGWVGLGENRVPCPTCATAGIVPSLGPVQSVRLTADCSSLRIEMRVVDSTGKACEWVTMRWPTVWGWRAVGGD